MENPIAPEVEVKDTTVAPEATKTTQEEMVTLTKAQAEELIKAAEDATALAQKKAEDAENYRKGMLKYKSKLKEDYGDDDDEDVQPQALSEDRIAQIVAEQLKAVLPTVQKPQEDELEKSKTVISELKTALQNRPVAPQVTSAGSNLDKADLSLSAAEKYYGPDAIAEMKRRFPNVDIQKVYENEKGQGVIAPNA